MTRRRPHTVALAIAFLAAPLPAIAAPAPPPAAAHELGQSYMFLRVFPDSVGVRVEVTTADLERALGFGWDPGAVDDAQLRARLDSIRRWLEPRFSIAAAGNPLPIRFTGFDTRHIDIADYVLLNYVIDEVDGVPDQLDIRFSVLFDQDADHRNLLVIEHNWQTGTFNNEGNVSLIFSPRRPAQTLDLSAGSVLRGFTNLVWLGVWHIWIGIDHILFLMALILPAVMMREGGEWKPVGSFRQALVNIATIVTFFTIAHSVTLSLAALDVVRFPSRLVESVIAASIAVAAWANLNPHLRIREWAIAFVFGLFHGFGFASVLGGVGLGSDFLVLSLLGFNVGVELGQLAIVIAAFPVLFLLRHAGVYRPVLRYGSMVLIAIALLWLAERALDFNVPLARIAAAPLDWIGGSR